MDKKEFHWVFGVLRRVGFQQNLGQKSVMDPIGISATTQPIDPVPFALLIYIQKQQAWRRPIGQI
jgi:hypothetical protein